MMSEVVVRMSLEKADALSSGMADLLCWVRGYLAGNPDGANNPFGHEEVRDMNIKLKDAMREYRRALLAQEGQGNE